MCIRDRGAIDKDPNLVCENARVKECQLLKDMIGAFRKYDHGYGQIILQVNCDDDIRGVAEYGLTECGATAIEFKFGQSAKGIQAMGIVEGLDKALKMKKNGNLILPDPEDPEVQKEYLAGRGPHFRDYNRLPMWTEEYLCGRIEELRKLGAKNIFFKMAGYDPQDMEKVLRIACKAEVDMVTFDGAGGGSGNSPVKMMNEWCYPTIQMESELYTICQRLEKEGLELPDIAITGGIASEDQVFKTLAFGCLLYTSEFPQGQAGVVNDGVKDIAVFHNERHGTGQTDHSRNESHTGGALGKGSADLIQVLSVDQAAEDCYGDLDSGHDGICHAQYGHHVDDHEVLRKEQDSYQSGPGIEGYTFHLIAGFRMVGFHPVGISHSRLGGVLGNFTGIVQGIEHTDCNNNEQYYSCLLYTSRCV